MSKKVIVALAEGFEEMEAIISIDILRRAGLEVITAATSSNILVTGSRKIPIKPDIELKNFSGVPEALVLPGGMPGAENLANSKRVINLIKQCVKQNKIVAAICASPAYALAKAGVLSGKKVTCYPGCENRLGKDTTYIKEEVVIDSNIITSAGPGTAFCFALAIVEKLMGKEVAEDVKKKALIRGNLNS